MQGLCSNNSFPSEKFTQCIHIYRYTEGATVGRCPAVRLAKSSLGWVKARACSKYCIVYERMKLTYERHIVYIVHIPKSQPEYIRVKSTGFQWNFSSKTAKLIFNLFMNLCSWRLVWQFILVILQFILNFTRERKKRRISDY